MNEALKVIRAAGKALSNRELRVLRRMRDEDEEILSDRGRAVLGYDPVSQSVIMALLRACAISMDQYSKVGKIERYHINGTGKDLLKEKEK